MHFSHKYLETVRALDLNPTEDRRATEILDRLIVRQDIGMLRDIIKDRPAIVFGCGPSLENDVNKVWLAGLHRRCVLVAADGAVKALLKYGIVPQLNVTDLDGDIPSIINANHLGCVTVVHAHAGNIREMAAVIPHLRGAVFGTTHSAPTEKVHDFGGFTDGDRAVHIVKHFQPKMIVLAGMDFGHVIGVYSGKYDPVRKPRGLREGKRLIEELAAHSKTRIYNMTSSGENIRHVEPITVENIARMV
jgi:2-amino-4-hydroxy-6-hydroxymethyldihydropteridine diphosphokinase